MRLCKKMREKYIFCRICYKYFKTKLIHQYNFACYYFQAFHDCVGPAGCDGCLNINTPDNAGLRELRDILVAERLLGFKVSFKSINTF